MLKHPNVKTPNTAHMRPTTTCVTHEKDQRRADLKQQCGSCVCQFIQLSCKKQAGKTLRLHGQTPDTDVHRFLRQLKPIVRKKHDLTITRKCENTLRVLAQMYKNQCKHCNPNIMLRKQAYDHITIAMLAAVGSANPKRDVGFGAH